MCGWIFNFICLVYTRVSTKHLRLQSFRQSTETSLKVFQHVNLFVFYLAFVYLFLRYNFTQKDPAWFTFRRDWVGCWIGDASLPTTIYSRPKSAFSYNDEDCIHFYCFVPVFTSSTVCRHRCNNHAVSLSCIINYVVNSSFKRFSRVFFLRITQFNTNVWRSQPITHLHITSGGGSGYFL